MNRIYIQEDIKKYLTKNKTKVKSIIINGNRYLINISYDNKLIFTGSFSGKDLLAVYFTPYNSTPIRKRLNEIRSYFDIPMYFQVRSERNVVTTNHGGTLLYDSDLHSEGTILTYHLLTREVNVLNLSNLTDATGE